MWPTEVCDSHGQLMLQRPGVVDRVCGPLKNENLRAWCVSVGHAEYKCWVEVAV